MSRLNWSAFDSAFVLKSAPIPWRRLWGTGLTTAIGLAIGISLGHLDWGVWAFMGGFTSLYVQDQPYAARGVTLALIGLGLAFAMAIGSLSSVWWAIALGLGFVAAAATYLTGSFDVPLPAGFMFVLVACISAALPSTSATIVEQRVLSTLGGAAIAWGVGMMDWIWDPTGPVTRALARAFHALAQYGSTLSTKKAPSKEHAAALAVMAAHRAAGAGRNRRLNLLAGQTGSLFRALIALSTHEPRPLSDPWPKLLNQMAARVGSPNGPRISLPEVRNARDHRWRRWREVTGETLDVLEGKEKLPRGLDVYRPTVRDRLLRGLSPDALVFPATLRIGIAVLASVVIAHFLGIPHPFWVPLTCAAVLQGVSTAIITQRTIQRAVGTSLGLVLAGALLAQHPVTLLSAILVVALQLAMLFFIARNYGISVVFITTLALLIIYSGTHDTYGPLMWARFKDTLLGAAVGLLSAFALFGRASSERLPLAVTDALSSTRALLKATLTDTARTEVERLRSHTLTTLLTMRSLYDTALGEMLPATDDSSWPLILAIERLGYLVVSLCESRHSADAQVVRTLEPLWDALLARISGREQPPLEETPALPKYPAIERQLRDLAEAASILSPRQALS